VDLDFNALTNALTTIVETVDSGNTKAGHALTGVLAAFGVIDVVLWGAWMMFGVESPAGVVKKFLGLQIWLWIIRGFQGLSKWFMKTLVAAASSAAGQAGGMKRLLDPSAIAGSGLRATLPLAQKVDEISNFDVGTKILMGLLLCLVMLSFIVIAVNVAWAVIEYYMFLSLAALLMPFALMQQTRFIADKGINAVLVVSQRHGDGTRRRGDIWRRRRGDRGRSRGWRRGTIIRRLGRSEHRAQAGESNGRSEPSGHDGWWQCWHAGAAASGQKPGVRGRILSREQPTREPFATSASRERD
jgi:hypothetical protein